MWYMYLMKYYTVVNINEFVRYWVKKGGNENEKRNEVWVLKKNWFGVIFGFFRMNRGFWGRGLEFECLYGTRDGL